MSTESKRPSGFFATPRSAYSPRAPILLTRHDGDGTPTFALQDKSPGAACQQCRQPRAFLTARAEMERHVVVRAMDAFPQRVSAIVLPKSRALIERR